MDPRARGLEIGELVALADMLDEARWCGWLWRWDERKRDGARVWTKVPMLSGTVFNAAVNSGRGGTPYASARAAVLKDGEGRADGVGWLLLGDLVRGWLDLDKCRDPVAGVIAPWAKAILKMCEGAYVEITPSGTGLRIMGRVGFDFMMPKRTLRMPAFLAAQDDDGIQAWGGTRECHERAAVEVFYGGAHFVTVTGWGATGSPTVDIGGVTLELWLLGERQRMTRFNDRTVRWAHGANRVRTAEVEDIVAALAAMVNEDEHWDEWSRIGMAAHAASGGDEAALAAWMAWSEQSDKHDATACEERWTHWNSSPATDLGFGTLRWLAREAVPGWREPSRTRGDEFDIVAEAEAGSVPLPVPGVLEQRAGKLISLLAARVIYVTRLHRWFDRETRLLLDEPRLRMLGQMLGVGGSMLAGPKGLAGRLGRADSGMDRAVSLTLRPGAGELVDEDGQPCVNTWRPSTLVPLKGATAADAKPWLDHAERLMPEEAERRRVLDRLAWALQNPGRKINSMLILVGGQETGKDTFLVPFWRAIGEHNHAVVPGESLGGSFNGYLESSWVLISEMPSARRRDVYEGIKGLLTTPPERLRINRKGLEEYEIPNVVNVVATSNNDGAMALAEDDRRVEVTGTKAAASGEDAAFYYGMLHRWYATGGCEAVAGFLLARDVTMFRPHARPPMTAAKRLMMREGAHPAVSWAMGLWDAGRPMHTRDFTTMGEVVDKGQAGKWQAGDAVARGMTWGHAQEALRMLGWVVLPQQITDGDVRPRVWCRPGVYHLARQLSAAALKSRLVDDRGKSTIADFD